jgi:hypothetical protein
MLRKYKSGDTEIRHQDLNALVDLANKTAGPFREQDRDFLAVGAFIWIANHTSTALSRASILGIGLPVYDSDDNPADFRTKPCFYGETPTTVNYWNRPAVLLESVYSGYVGLAQITGVIACQVNIDNVNHRWCDVQGSTDALKTYATGSCKLLTTHSQTGTQWALVELGKTFKGPLRGTTDAQITKDGSGTVSVLNGSGSDTTYNVTAVNPFATVASGKDVLFHEVEGATNPIYILGSAECA